MSPGRWGRNVGAWLWLGLVGFARWLALGAAGFLWWADVGLNVALLWSKVVGTFSARAGRARHAGRQWGCAVCALLNPAARLVCRCLGLPVPGDHCEESRLAEAARGPTGLTG